MATGKKYYWMKLRESFMTSDTVDYFMEQPNGANYVVLYQMLCLKTINTEGKLSRQIGEIIIPYDIPKIQRDLKWFSVDTIRVALNLYKTAGLIYEDVDGALVLVDHKNLVGSETDYKEQKRRQRLAKKEYAALPETVDECGQGCGHVHSDVHQNVHTEIEKEIEIDILSSSSTNVLSEANICAELQGNSTPAIILNDKTAYRATDEDIALWKECYPAVDVEQELLKMAAWSDGNPKLRKTRKGVRRFITNWLARAQDEAGRYGRTAAPTNAAGAYHHNSKAYKCAAYLNRKLGENVAQYVPAEESVIQRWAADFDALSRSDGYDMAVVGEVLAFAMKDDFWRDKIPDGRKFRDKFTTLLAQMEGKDADG